MSQLFTAVTAGGTVPSNVPITFRTGAGDATSAANIINILGSGGTTTTGAGNTVTINTTASIFPWTDQATNFSAAVNNGYFCTAGLTATLPAATQGQVVIIECDTASPVTVKAPGGQFISLGNQVSATGGTVVSSKTGDSLYLVFRNATSTWHSISSEGTWAVT